MNRFLTLLLAGSIFASKAGAQIYSQLYSGKQEMFLEAESYHLFEEYNEALPLYLELLKDDPGNAFLNYRAGSCYLNIPGKKETAIEYLEKAAEDTDSRDRRPTYRTTKAPLDALFYLGNAYHINYQFEEALEMYYQFREKIDLSTYKIEIVDEHIMATKNAISSTEDPLFFLRENLGERINTRFSETNPVVSGNKQTLVFTRKLQFYNGVFFSRKTDEGEWSWPMEITPQIGSDGDCYPVSLSYDGTELYLYKSDDLVGNIYVSSFSGDRWTPVKKLNENINTGYWESHACVSRNDSILYFTSNRPGGFGGLDIYVSRRNTNGEWEQAKNLGEVINTPYNEDTPFITEDGRTLYFSSYGHYNIGGYDVFYSTKTEEGEWLPPLNAGYGINTPDDDMFFNPLENGIYAFVSKFDDDGFGGTDIYVYEFFSDAHPRKFTLKGVMSRQDGMHTGTEAKISVLDPETGDTISSVRPHQITGEYEMEVKAGNWELVFSEKGHDDIVKPLMLPTDREDPEIKLDARLERTEPELPPLTEIITDRIILPEETLPEKTLGIKQHKYRVREDDNVRIEMRLEHNTILETEKYVDGNLISTEKINVTRRRFNYDYEPLPGENVLIFRYTDPEGDIVTDRVVISFHPPVAEEFVEDAETRELDSLINEMLKTAPAGMRQLLLGIDPDTTGIMSPGQLAEFLVEQSAFYEYNELYPDTEALIKALIPVVSDEMAAFLNNIITEGYLPDTTEELIQLLIDRSGEYGYDKWEILDVLVEIAGKDAPVSAEEVEEPADGRIKPVWWILLLVLIMVAALYLKNRNIKNKK